MTDILEYTLSLNDQFSSKLQKIGITTDTTLGIFAKLEKQANDVKRVMKATGGSVGALKMKLDHLKRERDWLPQSSINNIRKYNTEIKKLTRQINKLETINGSKTKSMFTDAFNQIPFSGLLTNPLIMGGLAIGKSLRLGVEREMQMTSFEVLLDGKKPAQKMMNDVKAYAKKTPYNKLGLGDAVKTMLGFNIQQEKIMPTLKAIGDIAMGDSNKMKSLTLAYSQMSSTGKLTGQDLLQMINAGFNPLLEISKKTGKSIGELKKEMEKGAISSKMVEDAFRSATQEGGAFHGMADRMSRTLGGRWTTLMDNLQEVGLQVFDVIEPVVSGVMNILLAVVTSAADGIGWLRKELNDGNAVITIITGAVLSLASAMLIMKAYTMALAAWEGILTFANNVQTASWWSLNAAMFANPVTWIVAGVVALIAAITWVISKTEGWGEAWQHTIKGAKLILKAFVLAGKLYYMSLFNAFMIGLDKMKIAWYKFKKTVGLGDDKENDAMIKKINADVEKRKKAVKSAYEKLKKTTIEAKKEFAKAYNSVHWKKEEDGATANGIAKPKIPGILSGAGGLGTKDSKTNNKTNKNIVTGGRKTQYINIHIKSLVELMKVSGKDFKESAKQMETLTADALLRMLAMASTNGN